ncbi:hypothetical protein FACS189447_01730 [Spirochaetia bacterium]|nr:hypothetical protein FACS189447_01730 [Spirochaetia bacterium]
MENLMPLLSICIPTYNRDYLIKECLNQLCPVAIKYNVNIVISDNASPDNTEQVVKEFVKKYSNIAYYKQSENIGPDSNYEFILQHANTKYRWLFGDSAIVTESNLIHILEKLNKNDYDLFILGADSSAKNVRTKGVKQKLYTNHNEFFSDLGHHITWISCLIYNERVIAKANFKKYRNTNFIHTGIILEYCCYNKFFLYYYPDIHLNTVPYERRNHWMDIAIEIFCKRWFIFIMSLPALYDDKLKEKVLIDHGIRAQLFTLPCIISFRMHNVFNLIVLTQYRYYISKTIKYPFFILYLISIFPRWFLMIGWVILFIPNMLAKVLKSLHETGLSNTIRKIRSKITRKKIR